MAYPKQYRYTKEHEWVDARGDLATIGITDYAQHELGDVVFVELPKPGTKLETGKTVQVPLFIKEGELIRIDTRTGAYMGRA